MTLETARMITPVHYEEQAHFSPSPCEEEGRGRVIGCTVAIPVFNRAGMVKRAIESALAQNVDGLEILVVDNASTDGTWEAIQEYAADPRVRLVRNAANVGLFGNFNRCRELAQGKYLRFLCSDDVLTPDCLAPEIAMMERNPSVVLLSTRGKCVDAAGKMLYLQGDHLPPGIYNGAEAIRGLLWFQAHYAYNPLNYPSGILLRREMTLRAGTFDTSLKMVGDIDFWLRMLEHGDLAIRDALGCEIVVHTEQISRLLEHSGDTAAMREIIGLSARYDDDLERAGMRNRIRQQLAAYALGVAFKYLRQGERQASRAHVAIAREIQVSVPRTVLAAARADRLAAAAENDRSAPAAPAPENRAGGRYPYGGGMNTFNYVRETQLQPVSIETLAIVVVLLYLYRLWRQRRLTLETVFLFSIPFSDVPFRVAAIQPAEFISLVVIAANFRKIRFNHVLMLACVFIFYSVLGYVLDSTEDYFSLLYTFRFTLTMLTFTILARSKFGVERSVIAWLVVFCFAVTFLQISLWMLGLPIHGVFYSGFFPRAKGLAQEPATWSIFLVALFPFILHFRLGKWLAALNFVTLLMTFSTLGLVATLFFAVTRWLMSGGRIRLSRRVLRGLTGAVCGCLVVVLLSPGVLNTAAQFATIFDKVVLYTYELSDFTGLNLIERPGIQTIAVSGRESDLRHFKSTFPDHWFVGTGSFNTHATEEFSPTNTYIMFMTELGVSGCGLVGLLLLLHYRRLFENRTERSPDFLAFSLTFLVMIAGIRCFAFHEMWYAQAATLRLKRVPD